MRFIEYMPFDGNKWSMSKFVPYRSMLTQIIARWPQLSRRQDSPNDTSKVSQYCHAKGAEAPTKRTYYRPWFFGENVA